MKTRKEIQEFEKGLGGETKKNKKLWNEWKTLTDQYANKNRFINSINVSRVLIFRTPRNPASALEEAQKR